MREENESSRNNKTMGWIFAPSAGQNCDRCRQSLFSQKLIRKLLPIFGCAAPPNQLYFHLSERNKQYEIKWSIQFPDKI